MQNFPQLSHVTGTLFLQTSLTMFRNIENNSKNLTAYEESDFVQARALFYACMGPGGGGVLPYIDYIDMCSAKGYGFLVVLV